MFATIRNAVITCALASFGTGCIGPVNGTDAIEPPTSSSANDSGATSPSVDAGSPVNEDAGPAVAVAADSGANNDAGVTPTSPFCPLTGIGASGSGDIAYTVQEGTNPDGTCSSCNINFLAVSGAIPSAGGTTIATVQTNCETPGAPMKTGFCWVETNGVAQTTMFFALPSGGYTFSPAASVSGNWSCSTEN